ncbi:hypothetical protein BJ322DRAFT_228527 [Thelephora terrestris]|uniref:Uncharacterized protein n=1 Tax=Thelephora terrestris TaxID=56493 RepID=A0A9P6H826_9AGAM|nr:hypothetical protein BJ322DRAFT_228527 [Thelephora terrestris]
MAGSEGERTGIRASFSPCRTLQQPGRSNPQRNTKFSELGCRILWRRLEFSIAKSHLGTPINSRPSSRTYKRIRFTDVATRDVQAYGSVPSSPKRGRLLPTFSTAVEPRDVPVTLLVIHNGPPPSRSAIEDAKEGIVGERTSQDILRGRSSCLRTLRALVEETFRETMFVCLCGSPNLGNKSGSLSCFNT